MNPLLAEAKLALIELTDLLLEENDDLRARKLDRVTTNVKRKNAMGSKVEQLLMQVKTMQDNGETFVAPELAGLQVALDEYRTHARQNLLLLKAAHEATADFLLLVKQTLDEKQPKSATYGNKGKLSSDTPHHTSLVNKAV